MVTPLLVIIYSVLIYYWFTGLQVYMHYVLAIGWKWLEMVFRFTGLHALLHYVLSIAWKWFTDLQVYIGLLWKLVTSSITCI